MSPSDGPPVSPRLLDQLGRTLRAVEEARRGDSATETSVEAALDDLDGLAEHVSEAPDGSLPDEVPALVGRARTSLEEGDVEEARKALVEVARAIDDFLKG